MVAQRFALVIGGLVIELLGENPEPGTRNPEPRTQNPEARSGIRRPEEEGTLNVEPSFAGSYGRARHPMSNFQGKRGGLFGSLLEVVGRGRSLRVVGGCGEGGGVRGEIGGELLGLRDDLGDEVANLLFGCGEDAGGAVEEAQEDGAGGGHGFFE